jgi:hypothetical protein
VEAPTGTSERTCTYAVRHAAPACTVPPRRRVEVGRGGGGGTRSRGDGSDLAHRRSVPASTAAGHPNRHFTLQQQSQHCTLRPYPHNFHAPTPRNVHPPRPPPALPTPTQSYGLREVHRASFLGTGTELFNVTLGQYVTTGSGLVFLSLSGVSSDLVRHEFPGGAVCGDLGPY